MQIACQARQGPIIALIEKLLKRGLPKTEAQDLFQGQGNEDLRKPFHLAAGAAAAIREDEIGMSACESGTIELGREDVLADGRGEGLQDGLDGGIKLGAHKRLQPAVDLVRSKERAEQQGQRHNRAKELQGDKQRGGGSQHLCPCFRHFHLSACLRRGMSAVKPTPPRRAPNRYKPSPFRAAGFQMPRERLCSAPEA